MKLPHSSVSNGSRKPESGFSLIEVTLAIGIMAFCMIPLLGLLPTGLDAQQSAQNSARAAVATNLLSTAIRSAQFTSRDSNGAASYRLPLFFSDSGTATVIKEGDAISTRVYAILENGSIGKAGDAAAHQTLFVQTFPPATSSQLSVSGSAVTPSASIRVYAYITWPALPTDTSGMALSALKNRRGAVESFVTYVPSN